MTMEEMMALVGELYIKLYMARQEIKTLKAELEVKNG